MSLIYEDAHIAVVRRPGGSAFTLVSFAELTARPDGDWFWGRKPAEQLDLDCIGFVAKRPNWYPAQSMQACAAAVRAACQPCSVGYGYSMGAYAALKWGRLLGLGSALAVAPQISIDPADMPEDNRFIAHHDPALHGGMRLQAADLPEWAAVVADPHDPDDRRHLQALPHHNALHRIATPFVGHWAIWLLAHTDALGQALHCAAARDRPGLREVLRGQRLRTPAWCRFVGEAALRHGHPAWGTALLDRAEALGLDRDTRQQAEALAMLVRARRTTDPEGADGLVAQALARLPRQAVALEAAGQILLKMGHDRAGPVLEEALALDPTHASAAFALSHVLRNRGAVGAALAQAQRALGLRPHDAEMAAWCGHLFAGSGVGEGRAAEPFYRAALALNPHLHHAHLGLANALGMQRRYRDAAQVLAAACLLWPDDARMRRRLRDMHRLRLRRWWLRLTGRARPAPPPQRSADPAALDSLRPHAQRLQSSGQFLQAEMLLASIAAAQPVRADL